MLVNSANIDVSKVAKLFDVPKKQKLDLEKEANNYKQTSIKEIDNGTKLPLVTYPLLHAKDVLELVCELLSIDKLEVMGKSRKREVLDVMRIYCFIMMRMTSVKVTLEEVGLVVNRDHATVLHHVRGAINLSKNSYPFIEKLNRSIDRFKNRFSGAESFIVEYCNIPQL